ncbi:O-acetylhomoserine (thiol)-lyase [Halanaerobium saccharolyticum]|jgi:O-acetylhomoserine (thiol)-lyase|uniref:homocysteine desulfhydrase n=1 Tax=Halanaerobium saccharolyticum TaxID=43595 RepID=A0A2T5RLJ0_9FIRM|nr:aminotransferase class I/II-fold pyridoxal phosphate-dependent enzyme [Halanaerobium saccharolyticum]PTW00114.1 O-acetylhomoserine (thiol)-lyase [Halanaerobium saccharolyticum]
MSREYQFETRLLLSNNRNEYGAVNRAIYQTNAFEYETAEELEKVFAGQAQGYNYTRVGNPSNNEFEEKMKELENGIGALSTASGMAAIAAAVLALVEAGDEIVAGNSLFGGTYSFFKDNLKDWGVKCNFVETTELEQYQQAINPKTKLIYIETVGNPKLDIPNIKKIAEIAHQHGLPLILDNTLMTPYLFQAKEYGVDVVVHSTSKFINGSSNSIGGAVVDTGNFNWAESDNPLLADYLKFGPFAYLARLRQDIFRNLGPCASPFNSYLNNLGVETLALRMEKHCSNALELARFFDSNSAIKGVNYPGLKSNPYHQLAAEQFNNHFGGLLTFEVGSKKEAFKVINELKIAKNLSNLGGLRTLVIHPASTIYHKLSESEKRVLGVTPALIRVSVGIESARDIIEDFSQALEKL